MAWKCEYTDTFGGEANYSWARRATIAAGAQGETQSSIMRRAKAALGITGMRGKTESYGDSYTFRPIGMCTVAFVTWDDWSDDAEKADSIVQAAP